MAIHGFEAAMRNVGGSAGFALPGWAGTAISVGSQLLGGVLGGKKKRGPDESDILAMRGRALDADINNKISVGKKYGIHPLTMLGVQSVAPAVQQPQMWDDGGPSLGQSIAQAGNDLSRAVTAGSSQMEKLQERLLLAQIEGQEIDNVTRASMYRRSNQPGNPPATSTIKERLRGMPTPLGYEDGAIPWEKIGYDQYGDPMPFFNSDELGDNDTLQFAHFFGRTLPQISLNKTRRGGRRLSRWVKKVVNYPLTKF